MEKLRNQLLTYMPETKRSPVSITAYPTRIIRMWATELLW